MATDLIKVHDKYITLNVQAVPKSSIEKIDGLIRDVDGKTYIRIRINSAAEDGKANKALIALLSRQLKLAKSRFSIAFGKKSRKKVIKISVGPEEKHSILSFIDNIK